MDYLNNSKRKFSLSNSKLSNIDKLLSDLAKHQEEIQKFKRELDEKKEKEQREEEKLLELAIEKKKQQHEQEVKQELEKENIPFSTQATGNMEELIDKHGVVEDKLIDHLTKGFSILGQKKTIEVHAKFEQPKAKIIENVQKRAMDLEDEFKDDIKSVSYYQQKIDIEAARFKNLTQLLEKEEKEIDKEIKKKEDYLQLKEEYEKERSGWIEEHKIDVQSCRQEKKKIKEDLESNLKKPSEMVESLMEESGPDYTGGED